MSLLPCLKKVLLAVANITHDMECRLILTGVQFLYPGQEIRLDLFRMARSLSLLRVAVVSNGFRTETGLRAEIICRIPGM